LDVLQIYIKYIEYCGRWVTIDQKNVISIWDIERESSLQLPNRHKYAFLLLFPIRERLTDLIEVSHIKLVAACSLDKQIIFWDILALVPSQVIKLDSISAHTLVYS